MLKSKYSKVEPVVVGITQVTISVLLDGIVH